MHTIDRKVGLEVAHSHFDDRREIVTFIPSKSNLLLACSSIFCGDLNKVFDEVLHGTSLTDFSGYIPRQVTRSRQLSKDCHLLLILNDALADWN
jgi:hypothetical protein